jgi:rare lipoprotein A
MSAAASSSQRVEEAGTSHAAHRGHAAIAFMLGIAVLAGMVRTEGESYVVSIKDLDVAVVMSLANVGFSVNRANLALPEPPAASMGLPRSQDDATLTHATIVGTASTYNPYRDGGDADSMQTASGEPYDPDAWTAAIQTGLRAQFGGVRYGRLYQPAFALVESGNKRAIVKINDVGPLRPGRVIDLNERSMRYFDPLLRRGLISDMKITLLPDADWTPGPVGGVQPISFASAQ